ncbi:hypothetical protein D6C86_06022 [Aureobasidium pullulans]|uniref:Uncharacterized protein n=1 Tax=Aureobasidium pullulans TaxID=5580 RepID=A0A4S9PPK2_AURPU|nr:hypothetical protein D6C94_06564 [Aureobasidium pullulans]THZ45996.1 hypothetical protein D6C87_02455 [Aureobasidium pullulans]THZ58994.1 hypothetical protein D6C86_06022 [Aureobasidium pullulans]THZ69331.1 hypothetical protein D6C88_07835 [Aureobasidium pullulans]
MLDPLNNSSLDGNHSSIQPDIRPIKSLSPKLPTSRERKQVAFVPTMKILKEEFPRDEEESSVGAFSHKATRKIIEPSPLPHSVFSRMKHNYELSKGSSKSGATPPQHTEDTSNLELRNAESWRSFDNRFTEEFFNHRKQPYRMSTKLESSAPALRSLQQSRRYQPCSSNWSNYSNVAVHGPSNAAISESGAPPSHLDHFAFYGQDPSRVFGSSNGGENTSVSSATRSTGGPVTPKAIRRKPAVSNFSMISTSAVWGSERSTSPATDLDRSYGKQPPLRDMLGPEWYELLRDSAVEPEQLCEDLIEYFDGLGISGRLVYCFGFCANESAIRLEPLRDGYRVSNGSYSIAPDIRTITLFTRPAQMLLLDSDDAASSPVQPVPSIELTDGLTKSIHRLQHEQDDRGTTQGTIQAGSHHTYVDDSLEPVAGKEVYAAVEVYCPNWFKNNRKHPLTAVRAGTWHRDYRGPDSPPAGCDAGASPSTSNADAAAGSAVGHGAVNGTRRHQSSSQAPTRHTAAKHLTSLTNAKSLSIPSYDSLHPRTKPEVTEKPTVQPRASQAHDPVSRHASASSKKGTKEITGQEAQRFPRTMPKVTFETIAKQGTVKPATSHTETPALPVEGPYDRPARWVSPCTGGKLLGKLFIRTETMFVHRRVAAQYKQPRPSLPLADAPVRRRSHHHKLDEQHSTSLADEPSPKEHGVGGKKKNGSPKIKYALPAAMTAQKQRPASKQQRRNESPRDGSKSDTVKDNVSWIAEHFHTLL